MPPSKTVETGLKKAVNNAQRLSVLQNEVFPSSVSRISVGSWLGLGVAVINMMDVVAGSEEGDPMVLSGSDSRFGPLPIVFAVLPGAANPECEFKEQVQMME